MRRSAFVLAASVLAFVIFAGLNLASWTWLAPARLDFTQNRLFTLSDSARTVVARLAEPIELELVYSRGPGSEYPAIRAHAARVRELVNAIAAQAGDRIIVRESDPAPYSDDEDRAMAAGLTPAPTDGGDPIYFGVIGRNSVDDEIAIPFLAPERDALLEYDLVRLIAQLDDPAPPRVAVISSLPAWQGDGSGAGDAFVLREMRRAFEIVTVDETFHVLPDNVDVLMLVHPAPLNEWQHYLIDQFLLRQGRALIAVDPASRVSLAQTGRRMVASSSLGRLAATLGVDVSVDAVADRALALPIETDMGDGRRVVEGQPLFIATPRALMSADDPVTADLSRAVNFGVAGAITATTGGAARVTTLVETTDGATMIPAELALSGPAPRDLASVLAPDGVKMSMTRSLAARISGELATAFPDGPPAPVLPEDGVMADMAREDVAGVASQVRRSEADAEVILIADSDAFDDGFYIDPQSGAPVADNAAFLLNALDNLAGDAALMALRSRAPASRPMTRVDALRASARERLYLEQTQLETQLNETQERLNQLQAVRPEGSPARSAQEAAEIARFSKETMEIRRRLRGIEREFREDIDALAGRLQLVNVWLPPLIVAGLGIGVFALRGRRRERQT